MPAGVTPGGSASLSPAAAAAPTVPSIYINSVPASISGSKRALNGQGAELPRLAPLVRSIPLASFQARPPYPGIPTPQQVPSSGFFQRTPTLQLPDRIPTCPQFGSQLTDRYGLRSSKRGKAALEYYVLAYEMADLERWSCDRGDLRRGTASHVGPTTWDNITQSICGYLGYCQKFRVVEAPTLGLYTSPEHVVAYAAFLKAKRVQSGSIDTFTSTMQRVLSYLIGQIKGDDVDSLTRIRDIQAISTWASTLKVSLNASAPPKASKDPETLGEAGQWVEPDTLCVAVEKYRQLALGVAASHPGTPATARLVHDALLACMCWSHLPPLRGRDLYTLQVSYMDHICSERYCRGGGDCEGNFIYQGDTPGVYGMQLSHHKNVKVQNGNIVRFWLPPELCQLLALFEGLHPTLLKHHSQDPSDAASSFLFRKVHGGHFGESGRFGPYWEHLLG